MSKLVVIKHVLEVLDPVRVGTSNVSVDIHPSTKTQFDYIKETLMEVGYTSGWMHAEDEFYRNIKGLGGLRNSLTVFAK